MSYRTTAVFSAISGISALLVYGLLGSTALTSITNSGYGMSLAAFLVSGVAFSSIMNSGPGMFSQHGSPTQIEEVMVTPTDFREFLVQSSFFSIVVSLGGAVFFFTAGVYILGLQFSPNIPSLITIITLGLISSIGLGFIGLGVQLVYKQTAILSWLLFSLTGFVGNMIVPVQILPQAMQIVPYLTPQYYYFTGIRVSLGSSVSTISSIIVYFAVYAFVLLIVGLFVLDRGIKFVQRNGTHRWT